VPVPRRPKSYTAHNELDFVRHAIQSEQVQDGKRRNGDTVRNDDDECTTNKSCTLATATRRERASEPSRSYGGVKKSEQCGRGWTVTIRGKKE